MHDESLLLYARAYDLVEDHTSISPLSFICLPYDIEEEVIKDTELISSFLRSLPVTEEATHERLEVVRDVSSLLSKVISLRGYTENFGDEEYATVDDARFEEPLLRYQAHSSLYGIVQRVDSDRLSLKEAVVDEDDDEGVEFPHWAWERRNEVVADLAGDRMAIDRKVLEYLRRTVKNPDHDKISADEHDDSSYNNTPDFELVDPGEITPPLSPLSAPQCPMPSISLSELGEELDPLNLEPEANLVSVPKFDNTHLRHETLDEVSEASKLLNRIQLPPPISSSPIKSPAKELRVEAPLTPPITSPNVQFLTLDNKNDNHVSIPPCGASKTVSLPNLVEEFIPPPSLDPSEDGYDDSQDELTESAMAQFTFGVMEPGAQFFLMQLQQEQLEDSTKLEPEGDGLRVELPVLNWQRPTPPWISGRDTGESLVDAIDEGIMKRWEYRKSLDIAGLCWTIGSIKTPQPGLTETIFPENEEELWKGIEEVFPVLPLETIIEDEGDSFREDIPQEDEDLECAKIQPKMDLDSLIERKRIQNPTSNRRYPISLLDPHSNLSSFLSLQNRNIPIEPPLETLLSSSSAPPSPTSSLPNSQTSPSTIHPPTSTSPPPPDPSSKFIISASFFSNRTLCKSIQSLCPTSKFIERDFTPSQNKQLPEPTPEADITVSPLMGILLTDFQTIRKRRLPTETTILPSEEIRSKISMLSQRYKTLAVGVCMDFGTTPGMGIELCAADCAILSAFTGFCESMGGVDITIIPAHGSDRIRQLSRWIVGVMNYHSTTWRGLALEVEISEKEEPWETFLRNAGMNSYAAQAVLTKLTESGCRLVDFVTIERESRRLIFEPYIGRECLERFEEVIGVQWQDS
ncbi:hypothetical protein TWF481_010262 [Arthrobotrys musiformis]|uniref:Uncharacterized protein n=1 Tax=Arthrobotrys musiformis TaxID=47236 RepID=A0AAV9W0H3_9PEZI